MTAVPPPSIIERLSTTGVTSKYAVEKTGLLQREVVAAFQALGCVRDKASRWYLRGTRSPASSSYGKARECRPSERSGVAWGSAKDAI